jgi:Family of unknown function (DUF5681)
MSDDNTQDDYKVGYRKPPKKTQFQKGVSGNPTGRPKKAPEFHSLFLKESESLMTIIDNGKRRRISKLEAIAKQVHNKAVTGNISALRMYIALYPQVLETAALQSKERERLKDPKRMTDDELWQVLIDNGRVSKEELEKEEKRKEELLKISAAASDYCKNR